MLSSLIEQFAEFICDLDYGKLPPDVIKTAKERMLDTAGAMVAGYQEWTMRDPFLKMCADTGAGPYAAAGSSECTYNAATVALIDATFGAAAELDDGHRNAGTHAGAVALGAVLAAGAEAKANGKEALTAVVLCYEVMYRLAVYTSAGLIQKGFHPTSIIGCIGAAVAAARLYALNKEQTANALGIAAMFASGMMEVVHGSPEIKGLIVGKAVMNGIQAAQMAKFGLQGPHTALEGKAGLFQLFAPDANIAGITEDLGKTYHIGDTYTKLYPTCRHTHAAVEAAIDLVKEANLTPQDIEKVSVGVYQVAYNLTAAVNVPSDGGEAKFSLPYCVATGICCGTLGTMHLKKECLCNPDVLAISRCTEVFVDPAIQAQYPARRGARVRLFVKDGRTLEKECFELKGSPERPVNWEEILGKVQANARPALTSEQIVAVAEQIDAFEEQPTVTLLSSLLQSSAH